VRGEKKEKKKERGKKRGAVSEIVPVFCRQVSGNATVNQFEREPRRGKGKKTRKRRGRKKKRESVRL